MGAIFVGSAVFLPQIWVWAAIVLVATLGLLEYYILANKAGIPVFRVWGVLCGLLAGELSCAILPCRSTIHACLPCRS